MVKCWHVTEIFVVWITKEQRKGEPSHNFENNSQKKSLFWQFWLDIEHKHSICLYGEKILNLGLLESDAPSLPQTAWCVLVSAPVNSLVGCSISSALDSPDIKQRIAFKN